MQFAKERCFKKCGQPVSNEQIYGHRSCRTMASGEKVGDNKLEMAGYLNGFFKSLIFHKTQCKQC
jgi:hypothetical protein